MKSDSLSLRKTKTDTPEIWMITDRRCVRDLPQTCLHHASNVDAILIREKDWTLEKVQAFCHQLRNIPTRLLLNWNGRFEPWTLPISGLHLGFDVATQLMDAPNLPDFESNIRQNDWHLGVSIHNKKEWEAVRSLPLHYCLIANVFETPCKPGKDGLGLDGLECLVSHIRQDKPEIKAYALGGLKREDLTFVHPLGLQGIALRSAFFD